MNLAGERRLYAARLRLKAATRRAEEARRALRYGHLVSCRLDLHTHEMLMIPLIPGLHSTGIMT